jgi:hypothetical protein
VPPLARATASLLLFALIAATEARSASLRFVANRPENYDFVDIRRLPAAFGSGEFTFEISVKPDNTFGVGPVRRATIDQLDNWAADDPQPYSDGGWWWAGNWLLDGFTRPHGISMRDTREGSFGLQLYGGGRVRWTFADGDEASPVGKVWAVQAWPATQAPSLLDGKWHHIVCVRRWRAPAGARLELWIDGTQVATTDIPERVDMRRYWDKLPHPQNPRAVGGWSIGSEVMTAWNYFFTQYEDYKGLVDDMKFWSRALDAKELAANAHAVEGGNARGLLAHFDFEEGHGDVTRDRIHPAYELLLHRMTPDSWSSDDASD